MADDPLSSRPQPSMQTRPMEPPGHTGVMPQQPGHGEHSYKGSSRLMTGAVIPVTGGRPML